MEGDGHCSAQESSEGVLNSYCDSFEDGMKVHGQSEEVNILMILWFFWRFILYLGCSFYFLAFFSFFSFDALLLIQQSLVQQQRYCLFVWLNNLVKISHIHLGSTAAETVEQMVVRMRGDYSGEEDSDQKSDHQQQVGQREH